MDWIIDNTSPLCLEEKHRINFERIKRKGGYLAFKYFTDDEVRALLAAIEYNIDLWENAIKGYPKGHSSVKQIKSRIELYKNVYNKLAKYI